MPNIDRDFLRALAEWRADGAPVSSLYLDVDGRRYPRRTDYLLRADALCDQLEGQAEEGGRDAVASVTGDLRRFRDYLSGLDRRRIRGVALFSCSSAGLWEDVPVPRPLPDRAVLAEHPYVLPLEALIETYESFCTVLVDREKARIFLASTGSIEEESDVLDDVPGQHDQGGWSQARYQRHIGEHVQQHYKHVAEVVLRFYQRRSFDHLILGGPEEVLAEFERHLHDYVRRRVVARTSLPVTASADDVLERSLAVEERLEAERERRVLERLRAEAAAGRQAVLGLEPVLGALNDGRVDTLVVPLGLSRPGMRCAECGRLAVGGRTCRTCGGRLRPVTDVVDDAVAAALRQSSRVQTLTLIDPRDGEGREVGALLRY